MLPVTLERDSDECWLELTVTLWQSSYSSSTSAPASGPSSALKSSPTVGSHSTALGVELGVSLGCVAALSLIAASIIIVLRRGKRRQLKALAGSFSPLMRVLIYLNPMKPQISLRQTHTPSRTL